MSNKTKQKKWTIILQLNAENDLHAYMLKVMEELYGVKTYSTAECFEDINFIVVYDGLAAWKFSENFAAPCIYQVKPNTSFLLDFPYIELKALNINENLANPENFEKVLTYIKKEFPAKHTGFIYKGHGGNDGGDVSNGGFIEKVINLPYKLYQSGDEEGIKEYIKRKLHFCKEISGHYLAVGYKFSKETGPKVLVVFTKKDPTAFLSYKQQATIIKSVFKKKVGFILLDCCWGMTIDNINIFKPATDYFIASVDEMTAEGIGYTDFLTKLVERPSINAQEVGNLITSLYYKNQYNDYDDPDPEVRKMGVSLASVRLEKYDAFQKLFDTLCEYLAANMAVLGTAVYKARRSCKDYSYVTDKEKEEGLDEYAMYLIDFIWFLENLVHFNKALKINDAFVENNVTGLISYLLLHLRDSFAFSNYKRVPYGKTVLGGKGIGITFPENKKYFKDSIYANDAYKNNKWVQMLQEYYIHQDLPSSRDKYLHFLSSDEKSGLFNKVLKELEFTEGTSLDDNIKFITDFISLPAQVEEASKWGLLKKFTDDNSDN